MTALSLVPNREVSPQSGTPTRRTIYILAGTLVTATAIYSYRIASDPLATNEAYSALAAARPRIGAIVAAPVLQDPGKQILYYILLHCFTVVFGSSELALRVFSLLFALATIVLVFSIARELFDNDTALAAMALWAFCPVAIGFARMARVYSIFVAIALAHLLLLWRVRKRPSPLRVAMCAIAGAAMLYAHSAGLIIFAAEGAMLARDTVRGRSPLPACIAQVVSLVLFLPYVPIAMRQSQSLLYGHWLDFLGPRYQLSPVEKSAIALIAGAAVAWLILSPSMERDSREPVRWIGTWA
ncbi:MAG TPA: glycosyltransferase family 39 protein, partial [Candidatus Binataceae bacterium]|nr:glycosyltransferase family 39 protein [Candidatus Binataceae bacterium]